MRKVVVPTDFSKNAFNALKYACQLFKYTRCDFFILHAYADEVYQQDRVIERSKLDELKELTYKNSEKQLKKIIKDIFEYSPNPRHKFKSISAFGTLTDEINDLINMENADIVLMGTRGETNDRTITFGSKTIQVLKYVQCPVLAIPENYKYHPPKELLFPSDYLVPHKRRELKLLCELTGSFRSSIHMLYIDSNKKLSLRQEDTIAITKYIVHKEIDLLIMVNSRHSHLEQMLNQSTIEKIGLHIKIPFLVLQNLSR
jgi:nucleotide-binding universal stress UspA family protein